jgi:predicted nucleic acid-binding protein
MNHVVILDSSPLGLLCNPNSHPQVVAIRAWVKAMQNASRRIIIPEIADYEVRRELIRRKSRKALALLDQFEIRLEYLPLSTAAMRRASELWAIARNAGLATASDHSLDGDVILAAQTLELGLPSIIATGNPNHLQRYTAADLWENIVP